MVNDTILTSSSWNRNELLSRVSKDSATETTCDSDFTSPLVTHGRVARGHERAYEVDDHSSTCTTATSSYGSISSVDRDEAISLDSSCDYLD